MNRRFIGCAARYAAGEKKLYTGVTQGCDRAVFAELRKTPGFCLCVESSQRMDWR